MKWFLLFILCSGLISAQVGDNICIKKLDKSKLNITQSDQEKISKIMNEKFTKSRYELLSMPSIENIRNSNMLSIQIEEVSSGELSLRSKKIDNLGCENYIYANGIQNYSIITIYQNKIYCFIQTRSGVFRTIPMNENYHILKEFDNTLAYNTLKHADPPQKTTIESTYSRAIENSLFRASAVLTNNDDVQIDVLVAYTPLAATYSANGGTDIIALISQAFAQTNYSYTNSGINLSVNPV